MTSMKLLLLSILLFLFMPTRGMHRQLVMIEQEPKKPAELILRLASCIPSNYRNEQIAWFEKLSRAEMKQPPSLKHQAACKVLNYFFDAIIEILPIPIELKENLTKLEAEMNNYYENINMRNHQCVFLFRTFCHRNWLEAMLHFLPRTFLRLLQKSFTNAKFHDIHFNFILNNNTHFLYKIIFI